MASDKTNLSLEVRRLIRRGEINEAIDNFSEVIDEGHGQCPNDCDCLHTKMKMFKKHILPVLSIRVQAWV